MFNIVLVNPEIPPNTGNISRTCAVTGTRLHLIRPLGFEINDKTLKRAGLDYWNLVEVLDYENLEDFFSKNQVERMWCLSTKAPRCYTEAEYREGDYLFFGKETKGLPEPFLEAHREEITLHKAAKTAFDEAGLKKLPKAKDLSIEYAELLKKKKEAYPDYRKARDEMQKLMKAQKNVEMFFAEEKDTAEKEQAR